MTDYVVTLIYLGGIAAFEEMNRGILSAVFWPFVLTRDMVVAGYAL